MIEDFGRCSVVRVYVWGVSTDYIMSPLSIRLWAICVEILGCWIVFNHYVGHLFGPSLLLSYPIPHHIPSIFDKLKEPFPLLNKPHELFKPPLNFLTNIHFLDQCLKASFLDLVLPDPLEHVDLWDLPDGSEPLDQEFDPPVPRGCLDSLTLSLIHVLLDCPPRLTYEPHPPHLFYQSLLIKESLPCLKYPSQTWLVNIGDSHDFLLVASKPPYFQML